MFLRLIFLNNDANINHNFISANFFSIFFYNPPIYTKIGLSVAPQTINSNNIHNYFIKPHLTPFDPTPAINHLLPCNHQHLA